MEIFWKMGWKDDGKTAVLMVQLKIHSFATADPENHDLGPGKGLVVFLSGAVMERILQSHRADIATGHQRRKVPEGVFNQDLLHLKRSLQINTKICSLHRRYIYVYVCT